MPIAAEIYYNASKDGGGSNLPVVLIHGAGGSYLSWPPDIRRLPGFRMYSIDLPGHGRSHGYGLQEIESYAEEMMAWMEAIRLHRAVFVGHSMGGAIALTLAIEHREHVLGIGLVSTGARLRVLPSILENTKSSQTFPAALATIFSKSFSKNADPKLVTLARERMDEIRPSVLHGDLIACHNFDILDSLSRIKIPTLVICGQEDEMTPLRYSQFLSDNITAAKLVPIPDAGHMVMLEQPQLVAKSIRDFLLTIPFYPGQTHPPTTGVSDQD